MTIRIMKNPPTIKKPAGLLFSKSPNHQLTPIPKKNNTRNNKISELTPAKIAETRLVDFCVTFTNVSL